MTQTTKVIAAKILRQLLAYFDEIPPELRSLYDDCIRKNSRLDASDLTRLLLLCSRKFSTLFAVFDALDECDDGHRLEILTFLTLLRKSGHRILISSRPHLRQQLQDELSDTSTLEISADEQDLRNYIITRLDQKGNKNVDLERKCLGLTKNVQGM